MASHLPPSARGAASARSLYRFFTEKARKLDSLQHDANALSFSANAQSTLAGAAAAAAAGHHKSTENAPSATEAHLMRESKINSLQHQMFMEYNNPEFRDACTRLLVPPLSSELSPVEKANVREMYRTLFRLEKVPAEARTRRVRKEDALRSSSTEQLWHEAAGEFATAGRSTGAGSSDGWASSILVQALEADLDYARVAGVAMARSESQNNLLAANAGSSTIDDSAAAATTALDGWLMHQEVALKSGSVFKLVNELKAWVPYAIRMKRQQMEPDTEKEQERKSAELQDHAFTAPGSDVKAMRMFCEDVAEKMGFDLARGRIELLHHSSKQPPSISLHTVSHGLTMGLTPEDVRITIPLVGGRGGQLHSPASLLRTLCHELGHALYEQNRPGATRTLLSEHCMPVECGPDMPASLPRSVAMHEGQALLFERIMNRPAFFHFLAPLVQKHFNLDDKNASPDRLFQIWQWEHTAPLSMRRRAVFSSSDPLDRCLEMCMSCEMERFVVNGKQGDLKILPKLVRRKFNEYFQSDLGFLFGSDLNLREMEEMEQRLCVGTSLRLAHYWSQGLFGYVPTYLVGSVYSAQIYDAMCSHLAEQQPATTTSKDGEALMEGHLEKGDLSPMTSWLAEHVWQRGSIPADSQELILQATGKPVSIESYRKYLLKS